MRQQDEVPDLMLAVRSPSAATVRDIDVASFSTGAGMAAFFDDLVTRSLDLVDRFSLTRDPPQMDYVAGILEREALTMRKDRPFVAPTAAAALGRRDDVAVGMNTTGMLLDRLSILVIKHWNLEHRADSRGRAQDLRDTQIAEIVAALKQARPGLSSINNKLTVHTVDAYADTFPDAYYGLITTNLLIWEAQEVLYNRDLLALPDEELRAYIQFFSRGNIGRNVYIQASDTTYWQAVTGEIPDQTLTAG